MNKSKYVVWAGGTEINDYYLLTKQQAHILADKYKAKGYDDVILEEVPDDKI